MHPNDLLNLKDQNKIEDTSKDKGVFTRNEIYSQPEAWKDAIDVLIRQKAEIRDFQHINGDQQVIFSGCGSTYYLSCAASTLFQEMIGYAAKGVPASELWLSSKVYFGKINPSIMIFISRSGETSETILACELFRKNQKGKIITLVCQPGSTLSRMGDLNLTFPSGLEQSVAQTRAFSTLYLATVGLSAIWANEDHLFDELSILPGKASRIIDMYRNLAIEYGNNLGYDRIYFLGSGSRYGLASELSLKMKEMSLTHSEAFHFLEFRHGPKSMVSSQALIIGLVSETNAIHELAVLSDVQKLGGKVISIGENNTDILINSGVKEVFRNILYLPFCQMLAYERAITKNLDPDRPTNLEAVVKLRM